MRPTLRQLEIFSTIAKHLNFSKAAVSLHLTQPAVSMQIKQLEECLGTHLIETAGRRVRITDAGKSVLNHIPIIEQQISALESAIAPSNTPCMGTLKISVSTSAQAIAFQLLGHFNKEYPGILLDITVRSNEDLLKTNHPDVELSLSLASGPASDFVNQSVLDFSYVLVATPSHPLAYQTTAISLQALSQEVFIMGEKDSPLRTVAEESLGDYIKTIKFLKLNTDDAIKVAVIRGLGISILPDVMLYNEIQRQEIAKINLKGMPKPGRLYLVKQKGRKVSAVAAEFQKFLTNKHKMTSAVVA